MQVLFFVFLLNHLSDCRYLTYVKMGKMLIKKAYNLGMVNKDNMLLRNEAINAYKNSI